VIAADDTKVLRERGGNGPSLIGNFLIGIGRCGRQGVEGSEV